MQCLASKSCGVRTALPRQKRGFVRISANSVNFDTAQQTVAARDAIKAQASNCGVFIDLRHPNSAKEILPHGFRQIPHYTLDTAVTKNLLPRDQPVYLADTWGLAQSEDAARLLESKGFTKVHIISGLYCFCFDLNSTGGIVSWGSYGGPLQATSNVAEIEKKYNYKCNGVTKTMSVE